MHTGSVASSYQSACNVVWGLCKNCNPAGHAQHVCALRCTGHAFGQSKMEAVWSAQLVMAEAVRAYDGACSCRGWRIWWGAVAGGIARCGLMRRERACGLRCLPRQAHWPNPSLSGACKPQLPGKKHLLTTCAFHLWRVSDTVRAMTAKELTAQAPLGLQSTTRHPVAMWRRPQPQPSLALRAAL